MLSGTPARPGSKDNVSDVSDYLTESCSQWFQPLMPPFPQLCCDKGQALGAAKSLHMNAPGPVTSEPKCSPLASQREEIPSFFSLFHQGCGCEPQQLSATLCFFKYNSAHGVGTGGREVIKTQFYSASQAVGRGVGKALTMGVGGATGWGWGSAQEHPGTLSPCPASNSSVPMQLAAGWAFILRRSPPSLCRPSCLKSRGNP